MGLNVSQIRALGGAAGPASLATLFLTFCKNEVLSYFPHFLLKNHEEKIHEDKDCQLEKAFQKSLFLFDSFIEAKE